MSRAQDRLDVHPEDVFGKLGSPERRKALQRHSNLQRIYGITLPEYERMWAEQEGLCAICGYPETGTHNRGKVTVELSLAVDHDHRTGAIRGLLCHKCNKAIGLFDDDPGLLRAAAAYVQQED